MNFWTLSTGPDREKAKAEFIARQTRLRFHSRGRVSLTLIDPTTDKLYYSVKGGPLAKTLKRAKRYRIVFGKLK